MTTPSTLPEHLRQERILEAGDMVEVLDHGQSGGALSLLILDLLFLGSRPKPSMRCASSFSAV